MKPPELPSDKLYYTIGEVAVHFGVNTSLIRYYEQEFPAIKPHKNKKGNRLFTQSDIGLFHKIFALTREKGLTLAEAKERMKRGNDVDDGEQNNERKNIISKLHNMRKLLKDLLHEVETDQ